MDITKILKSVEQGKKSAGSLSHSKRRDFVMSQTSGRIEKAKIKAGGSFRRVFPLLLSFPFDPFVTDSTYNKDNHFKLPYSPSSVIEMIKSFAIQKSDVQEFWDKKAKDAGLSGFNSETTFVTADDRKLFDQYLVATTYADYVIKLEFTSYGKYGRRYLADVVTDPATGEVIDGGELYELFRIEAQVNSKRVQMIKDNPGNKTENKINDEISKIWKESRIKRPRLRSIIKFYEFPIKIDGTNETESLAVEGDLPDVSTYTNMIDYTKYADGSSEEVKRVEKVIGNENRHLCIDYIEFNLTYGTGAGFPEEQKPLEAYKGRTFDFKCSSKISAMYPEFDAVIAAYHKDLNFSGDDIIRASVYEFKAPPIATIYEAYALDLQDNLDVIDAVMLKQHSSVIRKLVGDDTFNDLSMEAKDEIKSDEMSLAALTKGAFGDQGIEEAIPVEIQDIVDESEIIIGEVESDN